MFKKGMQHKELYVTVYGAEVHVGHMYSLFFCKFLNWNDKNMSTNEDMYELINAYT